MTTIMAAATDDDKVTLDVRSPLGVTTGDEGEMVRVTVVIPGLLVKKRPDGLKLVNKPDNFKLESPKFEERSFSLDLSVIRNKSVAERYHYSIRKLPDEIVPEKCCYKLKKDQVILFLHKKDHNRSWERELTDAGLESYNDEEQE